MRVRGATGATAAVAVALILPATAPAARTSITLFGDPTSWVGRGVPHLYTPYNADIHVERKYGVDWIDVDPGRPPDNYTFEFASPRGHPLRRGVYDYSQDAIGRYGDHPGLRVFGDGRACNEPLGRFEVRDVARRPSGVIKRLWLIYEQHCDENSTPGSYGEIRIREGHRLALPAVVRWPAGEHGSVGTASPVTFSPVTRAVAFHRARIEGRGRRAFQIVANHCSGRTIQPGKSCQVWVVFKAGPGTHRAKLRVRARGGRSYGARLDGFDWGGRTGLVMHSEKGDFVGQGLDYSFTPRNAEINRYGDRRRVTFNIYPPGDHWGADFAVPFGSKLTTRSYPHALGYGMTADRPTFDVGGAGRGCGRSSGSFTIKQLRFDPGDKSLRNFAASFVQRCEGATAALRGRVEFRAGDHTKPAPWMRPRG